MRSLLALIFAMAATSAAATDHLADWPKLDTQTATPACLTTLKYARALFRSDASLIDPPAPQADVHAKIVLQYPQGELAADAGAKIADQALFEKQSSAATGSSYRQRDPQSHGRWVLASSDMGWRGYSYMLAFKLDVPPPGAKLAPLVEYSWDSPLLLQSPSSAMWAVDVGQPFITITKWRVFEAGDAGARQTCAVQFGPNLKSPLSLLPVPVRKLATLLDGTLGSGADEGTLRPTDRIRMGARDAWAETALRPWALKSAQYNTRAEVDAGLLKWSHRAPSFRALYNSIRLQYPAAQRALAGYYRAYFRLAPHKANAMAAFALDVALRRHFTFPIEDRTITAQRLSPARQHVQKSSPWRP